MDDGKQKAHRKALERKRKEECKAPGKKLPGALATAQQEIKSAGCCREELRQAGAFIHL